MIYLAIAFRWCVGALGGLVSLGLGLLLSAINGGYIYRMLWGIAGIHGIRVEVTLYINLSIAA